LGIIYTEYFEVPQPQTQLLMHDGDLKWGKNVVPIKSGVHSDRVKLN